MTQESSPLDGYKELVDFKEIIGIYISPSTKAELETTKGIIHYLRDNSAYIIPATPLEIKLTDYIVKNQELAKRCEILLAVQRALLGAITPFLRAVFLDWDLLDEKISIRLFFIFDKGSSLDDEEEADCVAAEVVADFVNGFIETEFIHIDYPAPIPRFGKELVYLRKEITNG